MINIGNGPFTKPREILTVSNLSKSYGYLPVIKDISFRLHEREILGVIGPSGGGKTTLLKCMNFLELPSQGTIYYHDRLRVEVDHKGELTMVADDNGDHDIDTHDLCLFRRRVGFVFQGFNLWENRTVLSNLTLAPRVVLEESRNAAEKQANALCEQFGLGTKLNAHVQDLSGGERQRVAIIRALMMKPDIMLLDEITSALDPILTVEVMQTIRQLRDRGLTMIVVTHHLEFASNLCDRIMFLSDGTAVQIDTPDNLRNNPASDEVSRFLEVLKHAR